jgi:hypothetical protein
VGSARLSKIPENAVDRLIQRGFAFLRRDRARGGIYPGWLLLNFTTASQFRPERLAQSSHRAGRPESFTLTGVTSDALDPQPLSARVKTCLQHCEAPLLNSQTCGRFNQASHISLHDPGSSPHFRCLQRFRIHYCRAAILRAPQAARVSSFSLNPVSAPSAFASAVFLDFG